MRVRIIGLSAAATGRLAWLPIVAVLLAATCGGGDEESDSAAGNGLTVFADSSLTEVFHELAPKVTFEFAGSDELAARIRDGAPAGVFAAAGSRYPDELGAEGLLKASQVFTTNRLVVVVPADNPAGIDSVEDLAAEGVGLAIGAEGVPVGDDARSVLETMGAEDVLENLVSNEKERRPSSPRSPPASPMQASSTSRTRRRAGTSWRRSSSRPSR
jgi:molybdate transport system substrate-binding protein